MAAETLRVNPYRYAVPFTLATLGTAILGYDYATDGISDTIYHMGGINLDGVARLLEQIDGNQWNPEDPDDFRKMIRLLIALGFSVSAIATLAGAKKEDVEDWQRGEAPKKHPGVIMGALERVLRRLKRK